MKNKYFKRPNGDVLMYDPQKHDLKSLESRFEKCDSNGNGLKKKAKK